MAPAAPGEGGAPRRVLVTFASRHGSTAGVAERIAALLERPDRHIDLRHVDAVGDRIGDYDAVVLGSPVYDGAWPPEASEFVDRNQHALALRPLWLFSVGSFGDRHRLIGRMIRREPRGIGDLLRRLQPRDYRVFAGVIGPDRWPLYGRLLLRAFGGHTGDNRDWEQIEAWAGAIARSLAGAPGRAPDPACS